MKNKVIAMIVVLALMASSLVVTNVVAERKEEVDGSGNAHWILSNDGFGRPDWNLTVGEVITLQITNNSLGKNTNYKVGVWNGSGWVPLTTVGSRSSDKYGDLSISFRVPGWGELESDPVNTNGTGLDDSNGQWSISLFKNNFTSTNYNDAMRVWSGLNATIQIGNHYYLRFYEDGTEIDYIIFNEVYTAFQVKVFNWTGTSLVEAKGDATKYKFDFSLQNWSASPGGAEVESLGTGRTGGVSTTQSFKISDEEGIKGYINTDDKEKMFWIHVEHSDDATLNSSIVLPMLLDVTLPSPPDDVKWGDTFTVTGKVLDGEGTGEKSYTVRVYYPLSGGYAFDEVSTPSTVTTGTYSLTFETGSEKGFGAGTWYVGTYATQDARPNMAHEPPYVANFIPYHSFEVGTKDTASLTIHNTDDLVRSFSQTINVSVSNASWMDEYEFRNMKIHVTGINGYYDGQVHSRTDIVEVTATKAGTSDRRQYYEFDYVFNETGSVTIWASWPGNLTAIEKTTDNDPVTSSYSNRFGNHSTSLIANITGKITVSVGAPGAMNVFVDNVPEKVIKVDACGGGWRNQSAADGAWTNISVYGNKESAHMNATITVTGAGLDFTVKEDDTIAGNKYLLDKGFNDDTLAGAWYNLSIIPKTAGTLTITVTNGTSSIVRDYPVTGLTGSVTTSVGDDLEILVGTTETIRLTGVTEFAETKITLFDEDWTCLRLLNESEDAGEFTFTPDEDDIDKIGYIVVMSGVTGLNTWMYEIIEVVPIDDLSVEVITPDEGNQTLTVGLEQDVVIKLLDPDGDPVTEDNPGVTAKLIDDDNDEDDPLQTFTFTNIGDGEWEASIQPWFSGQLLIEGYNASTGIKHIGQTLLDVDYATITYLPSGATAGIGLDNLTIEVSGVDANGNPLEGVTLYLHREDKNTTYGFDTSVTLDEDGFGEFEIAVVGDNKTHINATLDDALPADGNRTLGGFDIDFPMFDVNPDTIYVGRSNVVEIIATDMNGDLLDGIYLTLARFGETPPDPVLTDADGFAEFSINPPSSGKYNLSIVKELIWVGGALDWETMLADMVITDTVITATHIRTMTIAVSKSPIYQGETLTVTVTSAGAALAGVAVEFAGTTTQTGANGQATFTVPDPGVESAVYTIAAEKEGYNPAERSITVIKVYAIQIILPDEAPAAGEKFTVTIIAKGQALAGATVEFDGVTKTSGADGKVSFTAPTEKGTYSYSASFEGYTPATGTITIVEGPGVPGFELLTLIAALGVAFILFKRRKRTI